MRTARLQTLTPRTDTTASQEVRANSSPGEACRSLARGLMSDRRAQLPIALPKIQVGSSRRTTGALRGVFDWLPPAPLRSPRIVFETAAAALKDGGRVIIYASPPGTRRSSTRRHLSNPLSSSPITSRRLSGTFAGGAPQLGSFSDASGSTVSLSPQRSSSSGSIHLVIIGPPIGRSGDGSFGGLSSGSTGNVADGSKGSVVRMLCGLPPAIIRTLGSDRGRGKLAKSEKV